MNKFITCTLPYANGPAHVGAAFEFVLGDVFARFWRWRFLLNKTGSKVIFNLGLDEHGQKIAQKAAELGYASVQDYCDQTAEQWKRFCHDLGISYDIFYRTSDEQHKKDVLRFTEFLSEFIYERDYTGHYCIGCESFKTEKELVDGKCPQHATAPSLLTERVKCFDIKRFAPLVKDRLVHKGLSNELNNILASDFDFPITRRNVQWAIPFGDDGVTLHCWFEALSNYVFAAGYHSDPIGFERNWEHSLQICGKDNLKFQAYIFQTMLLAAGIPQTKDILVHGTILDENGNKMSKSLGNVVDPSEQLAKYGKEPLRYYLSLGLNTYGDSSFSEKDLVQLWNNEVVGGFGNLVARTLHLVDTLEVDLSKKLDKDYDEYTLYRAVDPILESFASHDLFDVHQRLNRIVNGCNTAITERRPFDKTLPIKERRRLVREIHAWLTAIAPIYEIILGDDEKRISKALTSGKKTILFPKLEIALQD